MRLRTLSGRALLAIPSKQRLITRTHDYESYHPPSGPLLNLLSEERTPDQPPLFEVYWAWETSFKVYILTTANPATGREVCPACRSSNASSLKRSAGKLRSRNLCRTQGGEKRRGSPGRELEQKHELSLSNRNRHNPIRHFMPFRKNLSLHSRRPVIRQSKQARRTNGLPAPTDELLSLADRSRWMLGRVWTADLEQGTETTSQTACNRFQRRSSSRCRNRSSRRASNSR